MSTESDTVPMRQPITLAAAQDAIRQGCHPVPAHLQGAETVAAVVARLVERLERAVWNSRGSDDGRGGNVVEEKCRDGRRADLLDYIASLARLIESRIVAANLPNDLGAEAYLDLRWQADMRATKRWQAEAPGRELTWPDHADLVVWLLDKLDAAEDRASLAHSATGREGLPDA